METYTALRQFADSWGLVAMAIGFVGIVLWTLRPGAKRLHEDSANIPFRNEQTPGE